MRKAAEPFGESRCDFEIFAALADRFGKASAFTEGRDEMAWVETLYETTRENAVRTGVTLPSFEEFWAGEQIRFEAQVEEQEFILEAFRRDPVAHPLRTPSGRIELFSETVASFGYEDCPGHPVWRDKVEWLGGVRAGQYPLHLISNQPRTRLQQPVGPRGDEPRRETAWARGRAHHPADAAARGIEDGDIVRLFNERGACLASAVLHEGIRPGVIELPTGAWYDPRTR